MNSYNRVKVLNAASATIKNIIDYRKARCEEILRKHTKTYKKYFLFGPKITVTPTPSELELGAGAAYAYAKDANEKQMMTAQNILTIAMNITTDTINLSNEEFAVIAKEYSKE
jgi:ATP-dependent protease HslVU (ClpYQ) peptidase subunit